MNVDKNMEETLRRTDINDGEKQKLYYANLERYINLKHQKNNDFPTVNVAMKSTTLDGNIPGERREGEGTPTETLSDSTIVESIPKSMRNRAVSILNRLRTHPDIVSWNDTGQVKLNGERIQGSNISDLLGDVVRRRRNFNPVRSKEFFRVLSKLNMPKDLMK